MKRHQEAKRGFSFFIRPVLSFGVSKYNLFSCSSYFYSYLHVVILIVFYIRLFQIFKPHQTQIQDQQHALQSSDNLKIIRLTKTLMSTFVSPLLTLCYFRFLCFLKFFLKTLYRVFGSRNFNGRFYWHCSIYQLFY